MRHKTYVKTLALVFVLAVISSIFFSMDKGITGFATYTQNEVKAQVEDFVYVFPLTEYAGDNISLCLVINMGNETYSYDITKQDEVISVINSEWDCDGEQYEDIIIKYVDYESFQDNKESMTCEKMLRGGDGSDFWYLPSRLITREGDGRPVCNEEFQKKFCPAIHYCANEAQFDMLDLSCCKEEELSAISPELGTLASAAKEEGVEAKKLETPTEITKIEGKALINYTAIGIALGVIILITGASFLIYKEIKKPRPKKEVEVTPELKSYIQSTLAQGYTKEQIKQALIKQGWGENTVNNALGIAKNL